MNGFFFSTFGLLASLIVPFVIAMPIVIVNVIAGLAMLGILINSLKISFSDSKFQMGAFFALIIGISSVVFSILALHCGQLLEVYWFRF